MTSGGDLDSRLKRMALILGWMAIAAGGLWFLTRGMAAGAFRTILRLVPPLLMLLPAPVPNYEGQMAPAFIVFVFESLFQVKGQPLPAGLILLVGLLVGTVAGAVIGRWRKPAATA